MKLVESTQIIHKPRPSLLLTRRSFCASMLLPWVGRAQMASPAAGRSWSKGPAPFRKRDDPKRGAAAAKAPDSAEGAALKGLQWLARSQVDGRWTSRFACLETSGDERGSNTFQEVRATEAGPTAMALLAFLGFGFTPGSPQFGQTIRQAADYLIAKGMASEGRMGPMQRGKWVGWSSVWEHAAATTALSEYFAITDDARLSDLLPKATAAIRAGQLADGGWPWEFHPMKRSEAICSAWQFWALTTAQLCGVADPAIEPSCRRALEYFRPSRSLDREEAPVGACLLGPVLRSHAPHAIVQEPLDRIDPPHARRPAKSDNAPIKDALLHNTGPEQMYWLALACALHGATAWSRFRRAGLGEITQRQDPAGMWKDPFEGQSRQKDGRGVLGDDAPLITAFCVLALESSWRVVRA